jgi:acetyltransferase-like isoleucine patch superfamily enzyme
MRRSRRNYQTGRLSAVLVRYLRRCVSQFRAVLKRRENVAIGSGVRFGRGVNCHAVSGARITIGMGVEVGSNTSLLAISPGAELIIGSDTFISGGCTIAAVEHIEIGAESMIAELVSIRDHDHDPAYPPRAGHILSQPVTIGTRVWIGAKASVVRHGAIGDDTVVGAHGLVNRPIAPGVIAVGVPARAVRAKTRNLDSPHARTWRSER